MKARHARILLLTIAFGVPLPCLAQTPEPFEVRRAEVAFEELPVLNASEILRPDILAQRNHVRAIMTKKLSAKDNCRETRLFCSGICSRPPNRGIQ